MGDYRTRAQWSQILAWLFTHHLIQCQICESRNNLTRDHIVPRFMGGGSHADNIAVLCAKCNQKKDRDYYSWLQPFEFPADIFDYISIEAIGVGNYLPIGKVIAVKRNEFVVSVQVDPKYAIVKKVISGAYFSRGEKTWRLTAQAVKVLEAELCASCT